MVPRAQQELGGAPPEEMAGLVQRGRAGLGHSDRDR